MKKFFKSKIALFIASLTACVCTMRPIMANPLHDAVSEGNLEKVENLVRQHPDWVNALNENCDTPLLIAAEHNNTDIVKYLLPHCQPIVVNYSNGANCLWRALHYAAWKGNKEMIESLISNGATVDTVDDSDHTPLYYAVQKANREDRYKEIVYMLIDRGANPDFTTPASILFNVKSPREIAKFDLTTSDPARASLDSDAQSSFLGKIAKSLGF